MGDGEDLDMRNMEYKLILIGGLMVAGPLALAEEILDPSIFDGTGREQREVPEQTESSGPPAEGEGAMGEEDEEMPAIPGVGEGTEEEGVEEIQLPEEEMGAVGGEEEEEDILEEPAVPGSPAGVMTESRAGERVESTEKIAPGQAVDFPWDM